MPSNEPKWLTLSETAKRLGVHEGTVRRWADAGRIPSFRTPGGHRRFLDDDVTQFIASRRESESPALQKMEHHVLTTAQKHIVGNVQNQPWHSYYRDQPPTKRRAVGQNLLGMLLHYIASPHNREPYLAEAKRVMQQFGDEARVLGMKLHDTVQAYLFFRRSLTNAVLRSQHDHDPSGPKLIERMHTFWDELLLSIIDGYMNTSASIVSSSEDPSSDDLS